jgi:hypothetical protein
LFLACFQNPSNEVLELSGTGSHKIRNGRKNLFISLWRRDDKEIHKNTISSWIKELLLVCYQNPSKEALELSGTGSHEIRKLASSIVFRDTSSLEDILKVGFWKNQNQSTFTSFYLKDLSVLNGENMRSLGPIVAGQKIVINAKII